ncbi:hypothetical protein COCNU_scaffold007000G000020 [Cocos nucifera]|nr:hypothetical protein [Cocos nucifera]
MASDGDQKQPPVDKGGEGGLISFPKDDDVDDGKKKQLMLQRRQPAFQRIWFPEDEITVLRSLLKHRSEDGVLPSPCQLHPVIRSSLRLQASECQLGSKVQRLRKKFKKFMQNVNRSRSTFGDPHEQRIFDLSSQLWSATVDKKKKNEQTNAGAGVQKQASSTALNHGNQHSLLFYFFSLYGGDAKIVGTTVMSQKISDGSLYELLEISTEIRTKRTT